MAERIDRFRAEYHFLSNFYMSTFVWEGGTWRSVEHAYQSAKTYDPLWVAWISAAPDPSAAKVRGNDRKVPLRPDWEAAKDGIMLELLQAKFADPSLRQKLAATGDAVLVEGNGWHDNYWGDCVCAGCGRRPGKNRLGQLLMAVRATVL